MKKIGTHQAIALRPDDDLKLGKLVKLGDFDRRCCWDAGSWWWSDYSLRELIQGLEKNIFSAAEYRVSVCVFGTLGLLGGFVFPAVAIFLFKWHHSGFVLSRDPSLYFYCLGFGQA